MTGDGGRQLPRLALLAELTDRHVLAQLLDSAALTRAEIAARTGISKPTISESVRRLVADGLLEESGQQTGKRGPSGTYYRLQTSAGTALAVSIGPDGVVVEGYDPAGVRTQRVERAVRVPTDAEQLAPVVTDAVRAALDAAVGPVRSVAVSVAGPVDQQTGRLVALPDSPFVLGELAPRELLASLLDVEPQVDNDVNWAALAEHHTGAGQDLDEFFFVYLGPGIGAASVSYGSVRHGAGGLAGELAHVLTVGPRGRADRLIGCLRTWGLLVPGSPAIDVDRVMALLDADASTDPGLRSRLARAVAGALASATALLDPAAIVLGGPWGAVPGFSAAVQDELRTLAAVPTELRTSTSGTAAPLAGARIAAVRRLQDRLGRGGSERRLPDPGAPSSR